MLHILLLILKIIGIIIAVILGILVLLVCVVLFVPVGYELEAVSNGTLPGTCVKAKVMWLLRLVGVYVCFEDKELSWQVRVAWKRIQSGQEGKKTIETEVETYGKEMEEFGEGFEEEPGEEDDGVEKKPDSSGMVPEETGNRHTEDLEEEKDKPAKVSGQEQESSVENREKIWKESGRNLEEASKEPEELVDELERELEKILEETEAADPEKRKEDRKISREEQEEDCRNSREEREMDCKDSREEREMDCEGSREEREEDCEGCTEEGAGIWQKIAGICQNIYQKVAGLYCKIAGIYQKIMELPGKINGTIQRICDKIKGVLEKKDKIWAFLTDEVHQKAFLKVKDEVFLLVRRLKPRKVLADIHYGFEDPSVTGKVLAGISMCYPFLGEDVDIYPDFEHKVFDGRLEIKGRLRVSYFVKLLWKLVWCREVRMTYRHVRKFEL